jgi:Tol biopolymer transport system component
MTIERRADLVLPAVLGDLAGTSDPDYIDDVLAATARMPQRRASASLQRWLPTVDTAGASWLGPRVPWRGLAVALVILALLVASLALVAGAIRKQYAPPFGLAETGLVAFVSGDDIIATMPDGTGRRTLITGDGVQWGLIWSHRGDRFAYWSATPAKVDPASLWVADRDGSNRHRLTDNLTSEQADVFPGISWSPDDQQLAFADAGVLYVVNADGTGLHPVGDHTHQRDTPVWSPDGSLIAYSGAPLNDPYDTTSLWVITPDGLSDRLVIPTEGGNEIGVNSNPSWSPDSQSLLSHTGGDGYTPNSISIAHRDAAGDWSHSHIVQGSSWNYLPAWSTTGMQFTFLQAVDGIDGDYIVMVANADGTNVHPLSNRHVALATPCWTPDDRFIRAAGLGSGTDRTIMLFPLDGTGPVEIPALGDAPSAGCYTQRLAP